MDSPELQKVRAMLSLLPLDVRAQIPDWKHKYDLLYLQNIGGNLFVYRLATLEEVQKAIALSHPELMPDYITPDRIQTKGYFRDFAFNNLSQRIMPTNPFLALSQEYLLSRVVLYPFAYKPEPSEPAYIVNTLVRSIWDRSIYTDPDLLTETISEMRSVLPGELGINLVLYTSRVLGIPVKELEGMSAIKLAKHIVAAEYVSGEPLALGPDKSKIRHTEEEVALSAMRATSKRPPRVEPKIERKAKRTQLMTVDENLNFTGIAKNDAPDGMVNIDKENKILKAFMEGK